MLEQICGEIRNFFVKSVHKGTFEIKGGVLTPSDFLLDGQYFRIVGSVFNDGVYKNGTAILDPSLNIPHNETFEGEVWAMAIPPAFIALANEIKEYEESDKAKPTPYISESFDSYSYTKSAGKNGAPLRWQQVFSAMLSRWRKL